MERIETRIEEEFNKLREKARNGGNGSKIYFTLYAPLSDGKDTYSLEGNLVDEMSSHLILSQVKINNLSNIKDKNIRRLIEETMSGIAYVTLESIKDVKY